MNIAVATSLRQLCPIQPSQKVSSRPAALEANELPLDLLTSKNQLQKLKLFSIFLIKRRENIQPLQFFFTGNRKRIASAVRFLHLLRKNF